MKKVLFLVTHSDIGGAQKNVLFNARKLKKEREEVIIGTGRTGWLTEELEKENIRIIIFGNLRRSFNPFLFFAFCRQFRKFIKKEKIDSLNLNGYNTLWAPFGLFCLKNKPKIIFTVHGMGYLSPGFRKSAIKAFVWICVKVALLFIDEVIFVCNYDKELAEKIGLIKKERGRVVYNKIDEINFLSREEARRELGIPQDKIVVGTITRLEYAKNNEMLIEAFSCLPKNKAICVIIGSGPDEKKIKINDKVFLLGGIKDAAKYLKAFDVFVMTSRYEGMPYALLEAMSAGVPIIATRVGGIPEILEGKGILIEPGNVDELIANLNALLSRSLQNNHDGPKKNGNV